MLGSSLDESFDMRQSGIFAERCGSNLASRLVGRMSSLFNTLLNSTHFTSWELINRGSLLARTRSFARPRLRAMSDWFRPKPLCSQDFELQVL